MGALSKAKITNMLCNDIGLSKADAKLMVDMFFEEIKLLLVSGQHVKISSFGNFKLRNKSKRPGRNPKTGQVIPVEERRVVTFKPSITFKKNQQIPDKG